MRAGEKMFDDRLFRPGRPRDRLDGFDRPEAPMPARQIVYAIAAAVGLCSTWYFNLEFMSQNDGFVLSTFVGDNYVNPASASISNDIIVAGFTFSFWSFFEARRLEMRRWWLYMVLSLGVAIAFAMPLFMLMRERAMDRRAA